MEITEEQRAIIKENRRAAMAKKRKIQEEEEEEAEEEAPSRSRSNSSSTVCKKQCPVCLVNHDHLSDHAFASHASECTNFPGARIKAEEQGETQDTQPHLKRPR